MTLLFQPLSWDESEACDTAMVEDTRSPKSMSDWPIAIGVCLTDAGALALPSAIAAAKRFPSLKPCLTAWMSDTVGTSLPRSNARGAW